MCFRTLPFIRMKLYRSNNILVRWGRFTILLCLDALFSCLFYPWFQVKFWHIFSHGGEVTCQVFKLVREWNCRVFRRVVLFLWRIWGAFCRFRGWPCIFFQGLFWGGLIVWYLIFWEFGGICCVIVRQSAEVFKSCNQHLGFAWGETWFQGRFNWVFVWNRQRRTWHEDYNYSK